MSKRSKSKLTVKPSSNDPTQERGRQEGGLLVDILPRLPKSSQKRRHRARFASILDAYYWHGLLSSRQYEAGVKFGREYMRSVLKIKVDDGGRGAYTSFETAYVSAINGNLLLRQAFTALDARKKNLIISVCVENNRAGGSRRLVLLRKSLDILCRAWNL